LRVNLGVAKKAVERSFMRGLRLRARWREKQDANKQSVNDLHSVFTYFHKMVFFCAEIATAKSRRHKTDLLSTIGAI
jgi:hypothetical protein